MPQLAIVDTEKPAIDPLAALHSEKADLQIQIAELNSERERLAALAAQAGEEEAALREVDRQENALFSAWAATGAKAAAPALLTAERQAASERLALARAKASGAETAIREIDARLAAANVEARDLSATIDAAIFDAMERDFHAAKEKFSRALAAVRLLAANAFGTRAAILAEAENLRMRGEIASATEIFRRVEALDRAGTDVDASPSVGEVRSATEVAKARAAAMKTGSRK
jgi:hypothetical protein